MKWGKIRNNERGAVALITVLFIALLLTVVTTGFLKITINEKRQSTDDDLTKRAFYAAESGVEDAKIALDRYLNEPGYGIAELNGSDCNPADGLNSQLLTDPVVGLVAEYTCQLIDLNGPSYESFISAWDSRTIPLNGIDRATGNPTAFNEITLSWHDPVENGPYISRSIVDDLFPGADDWNLAGVSYPALMRVQISSYPDQASFARNSVDTEVIFISPSSGGVLNAPVQVGGPNDGLLIRQNSCSVVTGGYACSVTFNNFSDASRNYVINVTPLYTATNMQVVLEGGSQDMEGAQARIDVTGRAGDVYRRVQARVSLTGQDFLPEAAITSGQELCKKFNITDVAVDPGNEEGFSDVNPFPDPSNTAVATPPANHPIPNSLCIP